MRTDQLIESLAAELKPIDRTRISRALLSALMIGAIAALSFMFAVYAQNLPALIFVPFVAIVAAAASTLASVPVTAWSDMVFEEHSVRCLLAIPLLAILPFTALVSALRLGAPTDLSFAGAIAGLVAGGLGAAACALPCVDNWIPAIAIWYGVPIGVRAIVGAKLGPWLLRW